MSGQNFDPSMLVGAMPGNAAAGMGGQPSPDEQSAGTMEGLKSMLGQVSALAENNPAMSEGARMARQGIVQMLLALSGSNQPTESQMWAG